MARRPLPNASVRLRKATTFVPANSPWKVTARYSVDIGSGQHMRCVRVRCYASSYPITLHFSEQRFNALFESDDVRNRATRAQKGKP